MFPVLAKVKYQLFEIKSTLYFIPGPIMTNYIKIRSGVTKLSGRKYQLFCV